MLYFVKEGNNILRRPYLSPAASHIADEDSPIAALLSQTIPKRRLGNGAPLLVLPTWSHRALSRRRWWRQPAFRAGGRSLRSSL